MEILFVFAIFYVALLIFIFTLLIRLYCNSQKQQSRVIQELQQRQENIKRKFLEGLNSQVNGYHINPTRYIGYRKRTIECNDSDEKFIVTKDLRSKYELEFTAGGSIFGSCDYSEDTKKNLRGYYTVSDSNIYCTWMEGIDFKNQSEPKKFLTRENLQYMKNRNQVLFANVKGELQFDSENGTHFCRQFSGKYKTVNLEDNLKLQPFIVERYLMDQMIGAVLEINKNFIQNTKKVSQNEFYPQNYKIVMQEDIEALASKYTIKFEANGQLSGNCDNNSEGNLHIVGFYTSSTTEIQCTWIQSNKQIDTNLIQHNFDVQYIQKIIEESTIFEIVSLKGEIHSSIRSFFVGKVLSGTRVCSRGIHNIPLTLKILKEQKQ